MFDLKRFRKENGRITQMAMAEMFNCTQGNIYAIEASGRDLTDEQLNILKSKFGDEVVSKYIINLTLTKTILKPLKKRHMISLIKGKKVCWQLLSLSNVPSRTFPKPLKPYRSDDYVSERCHNR